MASRFPRLPGDPRRELRRPGYPGMRRLPEEPRRHRLHEGAREAVSTRLGERLSKVATYLLMKC